MIQVEVVQINSMYFNRAYSDKNLYIRKIGTQEIYSEAVDLLDSNYQYEETDKMLEEELI